ncbi:unnamed protein product [Sphenostylis stenocarpa]|uniref:Uncharacterized protein n=1 Tax=Sphenostylis stenocarpa TaxID=92480 RepID=A0AA86T3F2_9FABA|nr:unnamed protein product [Sphenostylis stenocarpa]
MTSKCFGLLLDHLAHIFTVLLSLFDLRLLMDDQGLQLIELCEGSVLFSQYLTQILDRLSLFCAFGLKTIYGEDRFLFSFFKGPYLGSHDFYPPGQGVNLISQLFTSLETATRAFPSSLSPIKTGFSHALLTASELATVHGSPKKHSPSSSSRDIAV